FFDPTKRRRVHLVDVLPGVKGGRNLQADSVAKSLPSDDGIVLFFNVQQSRSKLANGSFQASVDMEMVVAVRQDLQTLDPKPPVFGRRFEGLAGPRRGADQADLVASVLLPGQEFVAVSRRHVR